MEFSSTVLSVVYEGLTRRSESRVVPKFRSYNSKKQLFILTCIRVYLSSFVVKLSWRSSQAP